MNVLETERLMLRHAVEGDAPFILELLSDPAWIRYIGDRGVRTLDDARAYVSGRLQALYARPGFGLWVVELKEGTLPAGICGLIQRDSLDAVDIGFAFLPAFRSKGYAFESASAVMRHAREDLHLPRLVAITSDDNHDSGRLLERLGLRFEKMIRMEGESADVRLYGCELGGSRC